jgi:hypothetical protein
LIILRVYVAGKLNDMACDYITNVHILSKCAGELRRQGFSVFTPSNDLIEGLISGMMTYQDYFQNNLEWIEVSDAIFVCPYRYKESKGVLKEVEYAKTHNVPVFYDMDALIMYRIEQIASKYEQKDK